MFGKMAVYEFDEVKSSKELCGLCQKCSKKKKRTLSVCNTVSPYNKNEQGKQKDYREVKQDVETDLARKVAKYENKFICFTCERKLPRGTKWFE